MESMEREGFRFELIEAGRSKALGQQPERFEVLLPTELQCPESLRDFAWRTPG
jgi:hypothetical protein